MCVYHHGMRECENNYLMTSNQATYAGKEPRGGAQDGPVRRRLAARDKRASLRGEYEILLDEVSYLKVHQTSATYTSYVYNIRYAYGGHYQWPPRTTHT